MSVYLTGKVTRVVKTQNNGTKIKIRVPDRKGNEDWIKGPSFFYPTIFIDDNTGIRSKDYVQLSGFFVNLERKDGTIYQKILSLNVKRIETQETPVVGMNSINERGKIVKIEKANHQITCVYIETEDGVIVKIDFPRRSLQFEVGDKVKISGHMETTLKKTDENKIIYENFVGDKIEKDKDDD